MKKCRMFSKRRCGVVLLFLLCVNGCLSINQPNFVFIIADDLGWNDVGYHGSEIHTPYIDQLAREGVRLERYYVPPRCGPSRSCLMSGRYQIHMGIQHKNYETARPHGLPLDVTTLADELKKSNYATHLVGKWHLGFYKEDCLPTSRGFDTFYGMYTGASDHFKHTHQHFLDLHRNTTPDTSKNGTYSGEIFTDETVSIIQKHAQRKHEQPFFLVYASQEPHGPLQAPEEYLDKYDAILNDKRRKYAAMVSYLDHAVKRIHKELVECGLWENTVLVFTTDNGGRNSVGGSNVPLRGEKGGLWEGGVRGVGFLNSPLLSNHRQGAELQSMMHMTDWFPTLVGLAGGDVSGLGLDGVDQWPAINGNDKVPPREEILHNIDIMTQSGDDALKHHNSCSFDTRIRAAITVGKWKLLTGDPGDSEYFKLPSSSGQRDNDISVSNELTANGKRNVWLFDILEDPEERKDLSKKEHNVVDRLLCKLSKYNKGAKEPIWPPVNHQALPTNYGASIEPYL